MRRTFCHGSRSGRSVGCRWTCFRCTVERGKPADQAGGGEVLRMENGTAVYTVGSGNYSFCKISNLAISAGQAHQSHEYSRSIELHKKLLIVIVISL